MSEAKSVELLRVALTLLDHLDPQVQIDRRPQKGLDLGAEMAFGQQVGELLTDHRERDREGQVVQKLNGVATLCCSYGSRPDMICGRAPATVRSWSLRLGSGTAMGCCHVVDPPDRRFPDFVTPCAPDPFACSNWGSSASSAYTSFAFTQQLIAAGVDPSAGSVGDHRRPSHGRPAFFGPGHGMPSGTGTTEPRGR